MAHLNGREDVPIGHSIRSKCGSARTTFRPDWCEALPWVTYVRGTAGKHFASALSALAYLQQDRGFKFQESKS